MFYPTVRDGKTITKCVSSCSGLSEHRSYYSGSYKYCGDCVYSSRKALASEPSEDKDTECVSQCSQTNGMVRLSPDHSRYCYQCPVAYYLDPEELAATKNFNINLTAFQCYDNCSSVGYSYVQGSGTSAKYKICVQCHNIGWKYPSKPTFVLPDVQCVSSCKNNFHSYKIGTQGSV